MCKVPVYCLSEINGDLLDLMYLKASRREADGGIPGKSPYVITDDGDYFPLGFGHLHGYTLDDLQVGYPDRTNWWPLWMYGSSWVLYIGPENEPLWEAAKLFRGIANAPTERPEPDELEPSSDIDWLAALNTMIKPVETDELPF